MSNFEISDLIEKSTEVKVIDLIETGDKRNIITSNNKVSILQLEKIFDNLHSINGYWQTRGRYIFIFLCKDIKILEIEYIFPDHLRCEKWNSDMLILNKKQLNEWFDNFGIDIVQHSKQEIDLYTLLKEGLINDEQYKRGIQRK